MCIWCKWCCGLDLKSTWLGETWSKLFEIGFLTHHLNGMAVFMFCSILAWSTMRQQRAQIKTKFSTMSSSVKRLQKPTIMSILIDQLHLLRWLMSILTVRFNVGDISRWKCLSIWCLSRRGRNFGWWQNLRLTMTNGLNLIDFNVTRASGIRT